MAAKFRIPADLVDDVRVGLHSVVGDAAGRISALVDLPDREKHPDRYAEHRALLDAAVGLLDVIGWRHDGRLEAVEVELGEHRDVLMQAVQVMRSIALSDLDEAGLIERERAARGQAPMGQDAARGLARLDDLMARLWKP